MWMMLLHPYVDRKIMMLMMLMVVVTKYLDTPKHYHSYLLTSPFCNQERFVGGSDYIALLLTSL